MKRKSLYTIAICKKNKLKRIYTYDCRFQASITVHLFIIALKVSNSKMDVKFQSKEFKLINADNNIEENYFDTKKMNVNKYLIYQLFA